MVKFRENATESKTSDLFLVPSVAKNMQIVTDSLHRNLNYGFKEELMHWAASRWKVAGVQRHWPFHVLVHPLHCFHVQAPGGGVHHVHQKPLKLDMLPGVTNTSKSDSSSLKAANCAARHTHTHKNKTKKEKKKKAKHEKNGSFRLGTVQLMLD